MATAPQARSSRSRCTSSPMRRRHLRGVCASRRRCTRRPWTHSLFVSELALRSTRAYVVAKVGRDVVGYAGLMMSLDRRSRHDDRRRSRRGTGTAIGTRLLLALAREAIARGATGAHARGPAVEPAPRRRCTAVRVRAGRRAQGLLRRHRRGRARSCGRTRSTSPTYARAARPARAAACPARPCSSDRRAGDDAHPRDRDVVRRDRGGGRRRRSRRAVVGRVEPGRPARALRRRRSRDREPRARRAHRRRHRAGARRSGRRRSPTSTRSPRCTVPGSRARCSSA